MTMKRSVKNLGFAKKKYSFKIAGCQQQIKRPVAPSKENDNWLKSFYIN